MGERNGVPFFYSLFLCPSDEFSKQCSVSSLRVFGLAALVAQMLEKVFNESLHFGWLVCCNRDVLAMASSPRLSPPKEEREIELLCNVDPPLSRRSARLRRAR